MKNVNTGILLTPTEARGVADILRLIAYMGDCDEIVGYDIEDERKSAKGSTIGSIRCFKWAFLRKSKRISERIKISA